jgi:hypothetical protein
MLAASLLALAQRIDPDAPVGAGASALASTSSTGPAAAVLAALEQLGAALVRRGVALVSRTGLGRVLEWQHRATATSCTWSPSRLTFPRRWRSGPWAAARSVGGVSGSDDDEQRIERALFRYRLIVDAIEAPKSARGAPQPLRAFFAPLAPYASSMRPRMMAPAETLPGGSPAARSLRAQRSSSFAFSSAVIRTES